MKRTASAQWFGDLKQGKGTLDTPSRVLEQTPYSFKTRFENENDTNPEELIAAAYAGCFTMAFSAFLGTRGFKPEKLATQASLTMEQIENNWTVTEIHLETIGKIPGIDTKTFEEIADEAKVNCPISRLLNAKITLGAQLEK